MRVACCVLWLVGCGDGTSAKPDAVAIDGSVDMSIADAPIDASIDAPMLGGLGASCGACMAGLTCDTVHPGGYCTSSCTGTCANGVCNEFGACVTRDVCFTTTAGPHQLPALLRPTFATANTSLTADRTDSIFQSETSVAIAANGIAHAAHIDIVNGGSFIGTTAINGATRVDGAIARPMGISTASDPVVVTSPAGVHVVYATFNRNVSGNPVGMHLWVSTSTDDGATYPTTVQIDPTARCSPGQCDKPWIVDGPHPTDTMQRSLFVTYQSDNGTGTSSIHLARSDNGGASWTDSLVTTSTTTYVNIAMPAVDATGAIHVIWIDLGTDNDIRVKYAKSTNGGTSFSAPEDVMSASDRFPFLGDLVQPSIVISGSTVHVAYVRGGRTGAWDITLASRPTTGGAWMHRRVNDEPESCASHVWPALAADPARNQVHVAWIEDRFGGGAVVYAKCPDDPAMACSTNEAISDAGFTFTLSRATTGWLGDYIGLALRW